MKGREGVREKEGDRVCVCERENCVARQIAPCKIQREPKVTLNDGG